MEKVSNSKGFSVVESIVIVTVMAILTPIVIFSLGGFYDTLTTSLSVTTNDTDTRSAISAVATDLRSVTGFRATLNVASTTPIGVSGSGTAVGSSNWSYCGLSVTTATCDDVTAINYSKDRVLIAYTYATNQVPTNVNAMPVFINDGSAFSLSTATPVTVAYIYFVAPDYKNPSQQNLYRRTIVNVSASTDTLISTNYWCYDITTLTASSCVSPYQKTSCSSTVYATYPAVCKAKDAVLAYNVESLWVDYYDSSSTPIPNAYTSNVTGATSFASYLKNNAVLAQITITKKPLANSKRSVSSLRIQTQ